MSAVGAYFQGLLKKAALAAQFSGHQPPVPAEGPIGIVMRPHLPDTPQCLFAGASGDQRLQFVVAARENGDHHAFFGQVSEGGGVDLDGTANHDALEHVQGQVVPSSLGISQHDAGAFTLDGQHLSVTVECRHGLQPT